MGVEPTPSDWKSDMLPLTPRILVKLVCGRSGDRTHIGSVCSLLAFQTSALPFGHSSDCVCV